jgi:hypothetical protein
LADSPSSLGGRAAELIHEAARPMKERRSEIACIGLRAKTARAIVVVVAGTERSLRAVRRAEITLSSPGTPALFQPYHAVMDLPWDQAVVGVRDAERAIAAAATRSLEALLIDLRAQGLDVKRVAIVGAPDRKLAAIGSPHIRAHAAEGVLFRQVWQVAAQNVGLPSSAFSEKGIESFAATRLHMNVDTLRARLADFGKAIGRPWRADEKAAAMAAWMGLGTVSAV